MFRSELPRKTYALRGWGESGACDAVFSTRAEIALCRSIIANEFAEFEPRLIELETRIAADEVARSLVERSKVRPDFRVVAEPAPGASRASLFRPEPNEDEASPAASRAIADLAKWLVESLPVQARLLVVGNADPAMALGRSIPESFQIDRVLANEGRIQPSLIGSERWRPSADSFAAWMANASDRQRRETDLFVLGGDATEVDADLLRFRLLPNQTVLVARQAPAAAALQRVWDGEVFETSGWLALTKGGRRVVDPAWPLGTEPAAIRWPKVSVVTVSFNQAEFLTACLDSVLGQGYPNLEYVVIDGGSTDGSREILERYRERIGILIIEADAGQSYALNKGFSHATGEILTWINSDDQLAPGALRRAAVAFLTHDVDMVVGSCQRISSEGRVMARHQAALPAMKAVDFGLAENLNWHRAWERADYFYQPEVLFSADIWRRSGGFLKQHLYWAMDWELWLRMALAGARAIRIPDSIALSRVHSAQKTSDAGLYLFQLRNILLDFDDALEAVERVALDLPVGLAVSWRPDPLPVFRPIRTHRYAVALQSGSLLGNSLRIVRRSSGWLISRAAKARGLHRTGRVQGSALVKFLGSNVRSRMRSWRARRRYSFPGVLFLRLRRVRALLEELREDRTRLSDFEKGRAGTAGAPASRSLRSLLAPALWSVRTRAVVSKLLQTRRRLSDRESRYAGNSRDASSP